MFQKAAAAGFDAVLTVDTGVRRQQNMGELPLAVVVLRAPSNALDALRPLIPRLLQALESLAPRALVFIET